MNANRRRQRQAGPIFEALHTWLEKFLPAILPSTLTGKALVYLHS